VVFFCKPPQSLSTGGCSPFVDLLLPQISLHSISIWSSMECLSKMHISTTNRKASSANQKVSSENQKVFFEEAEGFFQRALGSYTHKFPKRGAASLTYLLRSRLGLLHLRLSQNSGPATEGFSNHSINFKDAYRSVYQQSICT